MTTAGIGVNIVNIERVERTLARRPSMARRVFTDDERRYCESRPRPAAHYAARFAARGAVATALGAGPKDGIWMRNVTIERDEDGKSHAVLAGRALELAQKAGVSEIALSLSLTHEVAVANAVAVTEDLRPRLEEKSDPAEELRATFRRARTVIDELERIQENPTKE